MNKALRPVRLKTIADPHRLTIAHAQQLRGLLKRKPPCHDLFHHTLAFQFLLTHQQMPFHGALLAKSSYCDISNESKV